MHGWSVLDAFTITERALNERFDMYWDDEHLHPAVYQEINDLLLNMLCGAEA